MSAGPLNGKTGEMLRWVIGLMIAGLVYYFSGIGALQERVSKVETLEESHFQEVQRSLVRIERFMERIEATGADAKTGEPYRIQGQYQK